MQRQKIIITAFFTITSFLASFQLLYAAEINIHAWLENNQVVVKCDNALNQPLSDAAISIFDTPQHTQLLTGKTNNEGIFSFTVPDVIRRGHGLIINVKDSAGQAREWTLTAAELYAASSLTAGFDEAAISSQAPPISANSAASATSSQAKAHADFGSIAPLSAPLTQLPDSVRGSGATATEVKEIVEAVLKENLALIRDTLTAQNENMGNFWIIAGIGGWIFGLAALLGLIFRKR